MLCFHSIAAFSIQELFPATPTTFFLFCPLASFKIAELLKRIETRPAHLLQFTGGLYPLNYDGLILAKTTDIHCFHPLSSTFRFAGVYYSTFKGQRQGDTLDNSPVHRMGHLGAQPIAFVNLGLSNLPLMHVFGL